MATLTMPRPAVSSPLAEASRTTTTAQRMTPRRNTSFPSSRALRPFPSIAHAIQPAQGAPAGKKAVKLIEPPKNQRGTFVLNLTQAEFSRQD
ncbi:hypothetical protein HGRIS_007615 [Hohenbuehelia grisea]|uniref:Uncharacterized protein n=1 Tax=Hohenbuehelia grisea TaxID=104357 RepID=A0ABR3J5D8_9AGAR